MKPATSDMMLGELQGCGAAGGEASADGGCTPSAAAMAASAAASAARKSVACACCRAAAWCRLASAAHSRAAFQATSSIVRDGGRAAAGAEELLHRLQEVHHRDRLGEIGLAAAAPYLLLVALHRKGGHRDDRYR